MCGPASAPVASVQFTITPAFNQVKQLVHYDKKLWLFSETEKHTVQEMSVCVNTISVYSEVPLLWLALPFSPQNYWLMGNCSVY